METSGGAYLPALPVVMRRSWLLSNATILTLMLILPVIGGMAVLVLPPAHSKKARPVALAFCIATFLLSILAASRFDWMRGSYEGGDMAAQLSLRLDWIRALGAQYFVGVDGLSMPLLLLTTAMSVIACWASFGISRSVKGYYALLLFLLAGTIGVFISLDLLLFYVFFELSLVPVYFLVGIWGGARKEHAAIKFFLYSLLGSLCVFVVVLGISYSTRGLGGGAGGVLDLLSLATDPVIRARFERFGSAVDFANIAFWLLLAGFGVRMAAAPVHTWLPEALVEAPTPVSMLIAAVVLKVGAYGLLRIVYPIFSYQATNARFYVALIAVATIVYGALVALAQKDFKRLVAYSTISQMGYVLLGLAVMTPMATAGAIFQMVAQGIAAAMMFFAVGVIYDRAHHREIPRLGGLWAQMPMYTGWSAVAFFAGMGLPGLCGFVGELLVLLGTFGAARSEQASTLLMTHAPGMSPAAVIWFGCIAAAAGVITAAYVLWTLQRVYMGAPRNEYHNFPGLTISEKWILVTLGAAAIVLGVMPMLLLDHIAPSIEGLMRLLQR
jgi:NADH-quinone oxidoreductase subunit M